MRDRAVSRRRKSKVDFSRFDGEQVSVVLRGGDPEVVYVGVARFERDDQLGNILRVCGDKCGPGEPQILLAEQTWDGRVIPDLKHGARYCFVPASVVSLSSTPAQNTKRRRQRP